MEPLRKDIRRELVRQKEWLGLLEQEVQIQKHEVCIQSKKAKAKALQDTIEAHQSNAQILETQNSAYTTQKRWKLWALAKKNIENLGIKSKVKRQRSGTGQTKIDIGTAKSAYYSRWGEEECCKAKTRALSIVVEELEQSKQEASVAKKELNTVTALLDDCQKIKEQYCKSVEDLGMKLQAANQQIQEQRTGFGTIRAKLCSAYKEIQEVLCKIEVEQKPLPATQENPPNDPPLSCTLSTFVDSSLSMQLKADLAIVMQSVADIVKDVEASKDTMIKTLRDIELKSKDNHTSIEGYKEKIEQIMPLYEVGLDTRHRKFELDIQVKDSRPDWDLVNKGNEVAHYGRALADATMCQTFRASEPSHRYPGEFEDQYNKVPAKVVWKYRDFKSFHNILSWHMDMRQFGPAFKNPNFDKEFKFLFSKIYPSFKIASDKTIAKDPTLSTAYRRLWLEYKEASRQYKAHRRERRDS
ncbi:hypothetical protein N431DRAFT_553156 [Stipitochalara longipes BDJ]|nr:hypothetical protein N431DRAFT_553156 [Stipitochalara longipes BDJ]